MELVHAKNILAIKEILSIGITYYEICKIYFADISWWSNKTERKEHMFWIIESILKLSGENNFPFLHNILQVVSYVHVIFSIQ